MSAIRQVAAAIREALHPDGLNLRNSTGAMAGQEVPHVHFHLVPRYEGDSLQPGGVWDVPGGSLLQVGPLNGGGSPASSEIAWI